MLGVGRAPRLGGKAEGPGQNGSALPQDLPPLGQLRRFPALRLAPADNWHPRPPSPNRSIARSVPRPRVLPPGLDPAPALVLPPRARSCTPQAIELGCKRRLEDCEPWKVRPKPGHSSGLA